MVPESLLREQFKETYEALGRVVDLLHRHKAKQVLVVGTPAPRGRANELRSYMEREDFFMSEAIRLGIDISTVRITELSVRITMWKLIQEMTQEAATTYGASFIPAFRASREADDSLKRKYWNDDSTHANTDYGVVMLENIVSASNASV